MTKRKEGRDKNPLPLLPVQPIYPLQPAPPIYPAPDPELEAKLLTRENCPED